MQKQTINPLADNYSREADVDTPFVSHMKEKRSICRYER